MPANQLIVRYAIFLAITACGTASAARAAAGGTAGEADELLRQVMQGHGLPSISVAVSRDGERVYARAFGLADIEHTVAATPETVYAIGSVSKTLTATAALKLAQEDKLSLEATVREYCDSFPEKRYPVTVQQLLAHVGGIRHYDYRKFDQDFLNREHFDTVSDALRKFAQDPLVAEPGSKYHYSSWGYVVAGCVIEGASGESYFEYLREGVLEPAGMQDTRLDMVHDIVPHRARAYSRRESGELINAGLFDASDRFPAGGLLSTPTDLVRFADALMSGRLLDESMLEKMWSSAELSSGERTGHGLGWDLADDGSAVFQGGTSVGYTSYLYLLTEKNVAVAISVNLSLWTEGRHQLAVRLAELFSMPQDNRKGS